MDTTFTKASYWLCFASVAGLVFFASWTDVFHLGRWVTPSSVFGALAVCAGGFVAVRRKMLAPAVPELLFALLLALAIISAFAHPNAKAANYLAAYLFGFVGLSLFLRIAAERIADRANIILTVNVIAILVVATFGVLEFASRFYIGINPQSFIPRGNAARAVIWIYPRIFGFSEEPTYLSWYFNSLGPIALYQVWRTNRHTVLKMLATAWIILAYLLAFSLAGIGSLILASIACAVVWSIRVPNWYRFIARGATRGAGIAVLTVVGVLLVTSLPSGTFTPVRNAILPLLGSDYVADASMAGLSTEELSVVGRMASKFYGTTEDPRQVRWAEHIGMAIGSGPFGMGPGYLSSIGSESSNNLPIFIAAELGLPAAIVMFFAFSLLWWSIAKSIEPWTMPFTISYTASLIHLASMSQFYHPCLWLVPALYFMTRRQRISGLAE